MIAFLNGTLAYKDAESAIIEANGVGFELAMSIHAIASLPQVGNPAQVFTYMNVKDDGISLYGFLDPSEKELFKQLISISGVGPKMAISALSTFKPADLIASITSGDVTAISKISGVGKKTAQRIILELQGMLKTDASAIDLLEDSQSTQMRDAAAALESMGFSSQEVADALKGCVDGDAGSIIRYALKHMGGAR